MTTRRAGITELFSGLSATVVLGTLYGVTGAGLFLFLGIIAGVLPSIRGLSKVLQSRVTAQERRKLESARSEERERVVLNLAREHQGRLTPAIVAVNSQVTLDDAESQLRYFADKGYADLQVTDEGRLEYVFPEFLPRIGQ